MLRRLGMAILCVVLPCFAFFSRGGAIILMPCAAIIIFLATVIDPNQPIGPRLKAVALRPEFHLMAALALWAGASMIWTPFPRDAGDRLFNAISMILLTAGAVAAIPDRMRAPALYMLPIGAFAAALAACLVALHIRGILRIGFVSDQSILRGAATLILITPPALGWLLSRRRAPEAAALAIAVGSAVWVLGNGAVVACFLVMIAAFLIVRFSPGAGGLACAAVATAVILAAPFLPRLIGAGADILGFPGTAALFSAAADAIAGEGVKMIAGHGLETTQRAVMAQLLPLPGASVLAAIWFDLGLLGALCVAAFVWLRARAAARQPAMVAASEIALILCAVAQMASGVATMQAWWLATLSASIIAMRAVAKGQFRTRRPRAGFFASREQAPAAA